MDLQRALKLKRGCLVGCPADRGEPRFMGVVADHFTDKTVHKNANGTEFIWVLVRGPLHKSVWPSNRLG